MEGLKKAQEKGFIERALANRANWHKLTLALAHSKPYELDLLDLLIMQQIHWN